jgi:hypothetical protein
MRTLRTVRTAICVLLAATLALPATSGARESRASILVQMFEWSNASMKDPNGFTAPGYARFYTADARLIIDGVEIVRGADAYVRHFERIRGSGAKVKIVTPFESEFRTKDRIYTYHVIQSLRDGQSGCLLAAGHAELVRGKIAILSLVRSRVDPASPLFAQKCLWDGN